MLNKWISESSNENLDSQSLSLSFENFMVRTFFWLIDLLSIHFYTFLEIFAKEINSFKIYRACFGIICLPPLFRAPPWLLSSETWPGDGANSSHMQSVPSSSLGFPLSLEAVPCKRSEMTPCAMYFWGRVLCKDIMTRKYQNTSWEVLDEQTAKVLQSKFASPWRNGLQLHLSIKFCPITQQSHKIFKRIKTFKMTKKCHPWQTFWKFS